MKKRVVVVLLLALFLILAGLFFIGFSNEAPVIGYAVKESSSFTKAICNESNYCQDYEIVCENKSVKSMNPITGGVQFPLDWQDPRGEEIADGLCD